MLVGSTTEGIAFAVDLTERKQAKAALRAALAEKVVMLDIDRATQPKTKWQDGNP